MALHPDTGYFAFSRAHQQALDEGAGPDEALGAGVAADFAERTPFFGAGELIAGQKGSNSLVTLNHYGLNCATEVPDELRGTPGEKEAAETIRIWGPRTTESVFEVEKSLRFTRRQLGGLAEPSYGWGGGWGGHCVLGYDKVLRIGIDGVSALVKTAIDSHPESADWYRGLLRVCKA